MKLPLLYNGALGPGRLLILCLIAHAWVLAPGSNAVEIEADERLAGLKVGWLAPGTVKIDGVEHETRGTYSFGAFFDFPMGRGFHYGFAVDFHHMSWDIHVGPGACVSGNTLIDISAGLKMLLAPAGGRVALRPGVAVGFGFVRNPERLTGSNYLAIRAGMELLVAPDSRLGLLSEVAVWYTPTGSNGEVDIIIGPLLLIRAGIVF
ncbi:MAG TPA: hypothetical protein VMY05_08090 [Acidobacteriota bacterium]|nr:hypothetical protein [Acidobacteriota bacterium]